VADFNRKSETETFVRAVCGRIRNPKIRRSVEAEYRDHIEDAVYHAMLGGMSEEEAFRLACRSLGAPENYRDLLADVHERVELPPELRRERRKRLTLWMLAAVLFVAAAAGAAALWGVFVLQMIVLGLAVWLVLWICRLAGAFFKRCRALIRIKKAAAENGFAVCWNRTVFTSLFFPASVPSVTVESGECVYKIRFIAALKKNRILHFVGRNLYIPSSVHGGMMLNHRHPFTGFVRPRSSPRYHYATHTDTAEFPGNVRMLPVLERRFDDAGRTNREVLIFNPPPMQVLYRRGNSEIPILGGETMDEVMLHDTAGFCSMLSRKET